MLHGARWLLNKDIVRGANSYPLKGIVASVRTETRAVPFPPSRQGNGRTRTEDTTLTRGGTGSGDYRLRDYNGLRRLRGKRFSSRGDNEAEVGRTAVEDDRKGGVAVIGSKEDTY